MALTRVQRSLAFALVLLGGGGAAAVYTLKTKVKTPDERFKEEQTEKRYFHFGRAHVKQGRLASKSATFAFARDEVFGWTLTEPVTWPADDTAIEAMLDRMAGIVADPTITDDATAEDLARAGLDRPRVRLDVELLDGPRHTLLVGPKNKMVDKYPITDAAQKRLGLSSKEFMWSMDRSLFEYRDARMFPFDPKTVVGVEIREGDELHVSLRRAEGGWRVIGEGIEDEIAGDPGTIGFMVTTLCKRMKAERYVDDAYDPTRAEGPHYGLDGDSKTVTVETKSGATRTVTIGRFLESGSEDGIAVGYPVGGTSVAALRAGTAGAIDPPAASYRDRTLARFTPSEVKKVRLEMAGEPPAILRREAEAWRMEAPKTAVAKVWRIDAIVRPFAAIRVTEWKTEAATKQQRLEWLLEPWSRRIVVYGEGDAVLADVRIGNLADDEHLFAMAAGETRVGLVEAKKLRAFPAKIDDLLGE